MKFLPPLKLPSSTTSLILSTTTAAFFAGILLSTLTFSSSSSSTPLLGRSSRPWPWPWPFPLLSSFLKSSKSSSSSRARKHGARGRSSTTLAGAGILHDEDGEDEGDEDEGDGDGEGRIELEDHTRQGPRSWRRGRMEADQEEGNAEGEEQKRERERERRKGIEECVGNTPMVRIGSLSRETGCEIWAKVEFMNGAGGSPKDRVALNMINMAEERGLLTPYSGDTIYEGTVGSTGISLATLCRSRGYLAHICMPSDQATEKSDLLLKLGAIVDRVPPAPIVDPMHYVNRARKLAAEHTADPNRRGRGYFADQFENEANWRAHYEGTGPEILRQCGGKKLDAFVAGAGTGGTISGVARYLKSSTSSKNVPDVKIVLADPQGSGLFNRVRFGVMFDVREREGTRRRSQVDSIVEGIGMNRVTANFEAGRDLIDDAIKVSDDEAMAMARWLVEKDGIFVGGSSAVNCVAAVKLAREMAQGSKIVTVLCDSGTRHISRFWAKAGSVADKTDSTLADVIGAASAS